MNVHYTDATVTLHYGDCLDVLRTLPDASVDAVVTDPPYLLGFMGRAWDTKAAHEHLDWHRAWCDEAFRVLKPGGHLLAFGGTRTWHRLACAVEDAGFEVRDSIAWLYGSGFPKSLDVSKAIDKAAGAEREVVGPDPQAVRRNRVAERNGIYGDHNAAAVYGITAPATDDARTWQGWGTALKPAFEPVVVARKPLAGTVAANVLAWGTGALNVDGCRIGDEERTYGPSAAPGGNAVRLDGGDGRDAGNARRYADQSKQRPPTTVAGRWPANVVLDESQAAELDQQSGERPGSNGLHGTYETNGRRGGVMGEPVARTNDFPGYHDTGGASRFFPVFASGECQDGCDGRPDHWNEKTGHWYCAHGNDACPEYLPLDDVGARFLYTAKASSDERVRVNGTAHPTVKPLALMRWLVRLVTPPGGTVLEPFAGSGTTVEACILEGFRCIAIEREADYLPLIEQRIHRRRDPVAAVRGSGEDCGLFDLLGEEPA